ncbi:hypothetical protein [Frondihabitans sucicola]|uniref:hypothetical protein n=1 Tax=Frondihabitans sucicola TaxID=1268041 RepID=UPI00257320B2|nr:hypothetical protein [Frondihabitans sucicola]
MNATGTLDGVKRRPIISEAVVVAVIVAGAGVMIWAGTVRSLRDGQLDSAIALFAGALLTFAFVPVFLSLGGAQEEVVDSDEEVHLDLGRRGRFIRYLGIGIGLGIGYGALRENFTAITSSVVALGLLVIRGAYKTLMTKAERRRPFDTL